MNKLDFCPFCKGKGECRVDLFNQWSVVCQECGATVWGESRDSASENWNRRVNRDGGDTSK